MSKSLEKFKVSIQDSKNLLELFNKHGKTDPECFEVLKRAGLIMAMTAWETYVEDRLTEALEQQTKIIKGSSLGDFVQKKLDEELKRFNTPRSDKTKKLYSDFLGIDDVTEGWKWSNYEPQKAREQLNRWIELRGDVVHHSKDVSASPRPHAVKKEDLAKCITFLIGLVNAFDAYLENNL
jgi:hypothetical protein